MKANDKTSVGSGPGNWQTPRDLFARMNRRWAFDFDAFASHENALCRTYSTVDGTFRAIREYAPYPLEGSWMGRDQIDSLDGLRQDWDARRVFLNPPYSRGLIGAAVEKCAASRNDAYMISALIPDARDTSWWRSFVKPYAQDFPIGRVRFINPVTGEPGVSPPGGIVVVVWTPDWMDR